MLKKIKVYGVLREFTKQAEFIADINSPQEAFSFLFCNFKGLEQAMGEQVYCIKIGEKVINADQLNIQTEKDIKIIPLVHGNFFAPFLAPLTKFIVKKFIANTIVSSIVSIAATQLVSAGINSLLSPQKQTRDSSSGQDPLDPSALASNYSFTGLTNITNAGVPVNIAYGEILVGSIVVSNGIDTVQVEGTN
tara:strand:- start:661 stop:1236 length:576 start_codon:yes stop_codon:yes gene_type:complete